MKRSVTSRGAFFVVLLLVTLVACSTAARIEVLNHQVGGFLPRPQPPSIEGNNIKWRTTGPKMVERSYRTQALYERGIVYSDEARDALVLTPEEQQELAEQKRLARLNTRFRSVVSTVGLLQYLLVPGGLLLCLLVLADAGRWGRVGAVVCGALLIACGGLMLYREYWPSLGW